MIPTGRNFGILPRGKTPEANTRAAFERTGHRERANSEEGSVRALAYSGRAPDATTAFRIFSMWASMKVLNSAGVLAGAVVNHGLLDQRRGVYGFQIFAARERRMAASCVASGIACARAVATMSRSAGSP